MSRKQDKVKWTERMNSDLLECKRKAKDPISSVDPPEGLYRSNGGFIRRKGLRILGAKKPEFTGSSLEIGENGARAELYTKY